MMQNKSLSLIVSLLSAIIFIFLFWLIYLKESVVVHPTYVSYLPATNAILNMLTAFILMLGFLSIKKEKKKLHRNLMILATLTSTIFLVSYVTYHHYHGDTKFIGQGPIRTAYFFILVSHIVSSMSLVPLVMFTHFHAWKGHFDLHKRFARWTFPLWLYVSVTGVLIYIFLSFFNN